MNEIHTSQTRHLVLLIIRQQDNNTTPQPHKSERLEIDLPLDGIHLISISFFVTETNQPQQWISLDTFKTKCIISRFIDRFFGVVGGRMGEKNAKQVAQKERRRQTKKKKKNG